MGKHGDEVWIFFYIFSVLYSFSDGHGSGHDASLTDTFMRAGWMAAFNSFEHFEDNSEDILKLIEDFSSPSSISSKVLDALDVAESQSEGNRLSTSINVSLSDPVTRTPASDGGEQSKIKSIFMSMGSQSLLF